LHKALERSKFPLIHIRLAALLRSSTFVELITFQLERFTAELRTETSSFTPLSHSFTHLLDLHLLTGSEVILFLSQVTESRLIKYQTGTMDSKPIQDEIDFAGLMDHKSKVAAVTGALKERAAFVLPDHVSVLAAQATKKEVLTEAMEIVSESEDPHTIAPQKAKAKSQKGKGKATERDEMEWAKDDAKKVAEIQKSVESEMVDAREVEDTKLAIRLSKGSIPTTGTTSSCCTGECPMNIDGGAGATGVAAAGGPPANGHVRDRWVYDSTKGAYFPPVGPLNGTPKWSCGKCGKNRPKFQHMFFIDVSNGGRLGGRQNCAQCLKRDFNSGKIGEWKLPKAPWE
jgi:hypothetical protein